MSLKRALRHLVAAPWIVRRAFPPDTLRKIEEAVTASERQHRGEVRFVVEGALDFLPLLRGLAPRERALELFSLLRVWDTEENTGVLLYVQLVDRDIEVVADRGIAHRIAQPEWDAICRRMEEAFRARRFLAGALEGIREVTRLLAQHFPAHAQNVDELPDRPTVL
ncbi:MAG: TPM domain-containing protein [Candidatus Methylomirabilales bacterium]